MSTKIQKCPSLILHQRNILDNNQLLRKCHPKLVPDNVPAICYFRFDRLVSAISRKSPFFVCQNCFRSSVCPFMSPSSCMTNLWSISFRCSSSLIKTDSCCLGWVLLQWESNTWVHWLTQNLVFNSSLVSRQNFIKKWDKL